MEDLMVTINVETELNNNILVIGAGEAGGRIAQEFSFQGFKKVVAINSAKSDLDGLDIDVSEKLLIPITRGGAGKDPNVIRNAIDSFYDDVLRFIREKSRDASSVIVCVGGGGGTGGGLGIVIAQIVSEIGLPVGMIYTLPLMNESTLVFVNALDNLKEIHQNAQNASISPLIIIDNNKLVKEFTPTAANFWAPLNSAVVGVVRKFNEYSQKPSKFISALDTQDLKRLLSTGGVCAIGSFDIGEDFDESKIDEEVGGHFFMDGFSLDTASACGVIIVGSEKALQTSSSTKSINLVFDKVSKYLDGGMFFRGVYADDNVRYLRVYILFNGLTLPTEHIDDMMKQVRAGYSKMKTQQNRLDDGVHVDFGSGVGGLFNTPSGARKIQRKTGSPTSDYNDDAPTVDTTTAEPNHQPSAPKVETNPIRIPGMKRGGR
jgi:cell division GTPase FtsZ